MTKNKADLIAKKVSLARQSDYKVGDDVLSYYDGRRGRKMPYKGIVTVIDQTSRIMNIKFDDGIESWSPFNWVHKLVVPNFADLGITAP